MSKSPKTHTPQKQDKPEADVAQPVLSAPNGPPPSMDAAPTAMVKPIPLPPALANLTRPIARERGESPPCHTCGSGMTVNHTERIGTNHPIRDGFRGRIVRYYQCKNPQCPIGRTEPYKLVTPAKKERR